MRVLSGIQSSGKLHLGNYLGAMKQHIELQQQHECFFFIANYHSLTTIQNADLVRQYTLDVALDYLAQPHLTLEEIAAKLGFQESASFSRAFRRWTGRPPRGT